MVDIKNLIKDRKVKFDFYRAGVMYYMVNDDTNKYRFPVRLENDDIGEATLLSEDKSIMFMRYIRKAIQNNELVKI